MKDKEKEFSLFSKQTTSVFQFLETEFEFTLEQLDPYCFLAKSNSCLIEIEMDLPTVNIAISPANNENNKIFIGFIWIMGALFPNIHFSPLPISNINEISSELKRQAQIFRRYAKEFLRGDFSRWPLVENYAKKHEENWKIKQ